MINKESRNTNKMDSIQTSVLDKKSTLLSYISRLECSGCHKEYSYAEIHTFCPSCQSPLLSIYDLQSVRVHVDRDEISRRPRGMWRWNELLPVLDVKNQVFLGEGDTPLLPLPRLKR